MLYFYNTSVRWRWVVGMSIEAEEMRKKREIGGNVLTPSLKRSNNAPHLLRHEFILHSHISVQADSCPYVIILYTLNLQTSNYCSYHTMACFCVISYIQISFGSYLCSALCFVYITPVHTTFMFHDSL